MDERTANVTYAKSVQYHLMYLVFLLLILWYKTKKGIIIKSQISTIFALFSSLVLDCYTGLRVL